MATPCPARPLLPTNWTKNNNSPLPSAPRRAIGAPPTAQRFLREPVRSNAQVAQLVEHATENRSVGGSIPPLGTTSLSQCRISRSLPQSVCETSRKCVIYRHHASTGQTPNFIFADPAVLINSASTSFDTWPLTYDQHLRVVEQVAFATTEHPFIGNPRSSPGQASYRSSYRRILQYAPDELWPHDPSLRNQGYCDNGA